MLCGGRGHKGSNWRNLFILNGGLSRLKIVRQTRDLNEDQIYQVFVNFDEQYGVYSTRGGEIREMLSKAPDISFILDKRLDLCGMMPVPTITDGEVISNYVGLLAKIVNNRNTLPNLTADSLLNLGYVLAFAAPSCYANAIGNFETTLTSLNIKPTKMKAFKPSQPYPLMDNMDLWVSKVEIAPFLGKEGNEHLVTSKEVVDYILQNMRGFNQ